MNTDNVQLVRFQGLYSMKQTRVLIVDDHAVVRRGIQMFLDTDPSIQIVGETDDARDAVHHAKRLKPDVILMDLVLPQSSGIKAIAEIRGCLALSNVKIIVLTSFGDEARVRSALEAGADGYLLKDADGEALLEAIHAVQQGDMPIHPQVTRYLMGSVTRYNNGKRPLTEREKEVLQLVAKGLSNQAIAQALSLSRGTVKVHVSNILSKLKASSRTEAAVQALHLGLIMSVKDD
jgi:NarL family two-component system response regulator LiaR